MTRLDEELASLGENVRLVSLADGSVNGQPRWWCTLQHRLSPILAEIVHGEAENPLAALKLAKSKLSPAFQAFQAFQAPKLEDLL